MDNQILAALIVSIPPTLVSGVSVWMAHNAKKQVHEIHLAMNSRFDQWMVDTKKASFAEGVKSEEDKK